MQQRLRNMTIDNNPSAKDLKNKISRLEESNGLLKIMLQESKQNHDAASGAWSKERKAYEAPPSKHRIT